MQLSREHCTELSQFYFTSLFMWLKIFMFWILILKACSVLLLSPLSCWPMTHDIIWRERSITSEYVNSKQLYFCLPLNLCYSRKLKVDWCCFLWPSFLENLVVNYVICDACRTVLLVIWTFNEYLESLRVCDSRACNIQLTMGKERLWHVNSNLQRYGWWLKNKWTICYLILLPFSVSVLDSCWRWWQRQAW